MSSRLIQLLNEQKGHIADVLLDTPAGERAPGRTPEERRTSLLASLDSMIGMLQQRSNVLEQTLEELARSQLSGGADSGNVLVAIEAERNAVYAAIREAYPDAVDALETLSELDRLNSLRQRAVLSLAYQQMVEQLQRVSGDQLALRAVVQELSTPIIPVYSGVLVLPLVGRIDSNRAQDITESLLEAIAREQADLVIIDITGIATIDTSVANHLMQTARAASLLGSQVVLVGISAEIAQMLVTLGVDLGALVTLGDLQSGIEYALDRLGMAIKAKA